MLVTQRELSIQILQRHSVNLSQLVLPAETLYTEGVISKEIFYEMTRSSSQLTDGPLQELSNTVSENPNQLSVFATVLLQSEETVLKHKIFSKNFMVNEFEVSTCILQMLCVSLSLVCSAKDIHSPLPPLYQRPEINIY